jgi:hypothetical protein
MRALGYPVRTSSDLASRAPDGSGGVRTHSRRRPWRREGWAGAPLGRPARRGRHFGGVKLPARCHSVSVLGRPFWSGRLLLLLPPLVLRPRVAPPPHTRSGCPAYTVRVALPVSALPQSAVGREWKAGTRRRRSPVDDGEGRPGKTAPERRRRGAVSRKFSKRMPTVPIVFAAVGTGKHPYQKYRGFGPGGAE